MDAVKVEDGARQVYEGLLVIAQEIPNLTFRQNIEHLAGICSSSLFSDSPIMARLAESNPEYEEAYKRAAKVASEYRAKLHQVVNS